MKLDSERRRHKTKSRPEAAFCLRSFGFRVRDAGGEGLADMAGGTLFTVDDFLIDEEIPHGIRGFGALAEPVLDAIGLQIQLHRLDARIIGTDDFEGLAPRILVLWGNDHTEGGRIFAADASEANGVHSDAGMWL